MADETAASREDRMVVVARDASGRPAIWCDPEIADLVTALNEGGVATIASCSGHGYRPGSIALADGRWLIIAKDDEERAQIDAIFPFNINGDPVVPPTASKSPHRLQRAAKAVVSELAEMEAERGTSFRETFDDPRTGVPTKNRAFISVSALRELQAALEAKP